MKQPQKNNSLDALHPIFRAALEHWLEQARATFPQFNIRVSETRRTFERQRWLFGSGRPNFNPHGRAGRILTYTLDSRHRWGLAADLVMVRVLTPWRAEWDWRVWRAVYQAVPPADYNLRVLNFELVHLELANADELIASAEKYKLIQT